MNVRKLSISLLQMYNYFRRNRHLRAVFFAGQVTICQHPPSQRATEPFPAAAPRAEAGRCEALPHAVRNFLRHRIGGAEKFRIFGDIKNF